MARRDRGFAAERALGPGLCRSGKSKKPGRNSELRDWAEFAGDEARRRKDGTTAGINKKPRGSLKDTDTPMAHELQENNPRLPISEGTPVRVGYGRIVVIGAQALVG